MKLDESIELQNIKKINNKKLIDMRGLGDNINVEQMRKYLQEVMGSEQSHQLMEILTNEGFLNITESDGAQVQFEELIQDDELCQEMYESYIQGLKEYSDYYSDFIKVKGYDNRDEDINDPRQRIDVGEGDLVYEEDDDEDDYDDDDDDDTALPTYLKKMEVNLNKMVLKFETFLQKGTKDSKSLPFYFSKMNPNDFLDVFHLREFNLESFINFLSRGDESGEDYYNRLTRDGDPTFNRIFNDFVQPSKRLFIGRRLDELGVELKGVSGGEKSTLIQDKINFYESMEDTLNELSAMDDDIFKLCQRLYTERTNIGLRKEKKQKKPTRSTRLSDLDFNDSEAFTDDSVYSDVDNDSVEILPMQDIPDGEDGEEDYDDEEKKDDDFIAEEIIREIKANVRAKGTEVKGQAVDHENKTTSDKENSVITKDAAESQKTIQQKVDNLKTQKYERDEEGQKIKDMSLGFNNALDLEYNGGLSKEQEDRIEDLANGLPNNKEDVNVDHDAEGGEKLIAAAKERKKNGERNYSTPPVKMTKVDEQLVRMKRIIQHT